MRMTVCRLKECSVRFGEFSRGFGEGAFADLDEVVVPATKSAPPVTLGALLGERAKHFEPIARPAAPVVQEDPAAIAPVSGGAK